MAHGMASINVWPGKITKIIDPHYFWMHFGTNELLQQFELLQREILQFCKSNWTNVGDSEHLQYGQVVLIDTSINDGTQYRRAQVTRMTSTNSVDVFYVDYGLTELKTTDCICTNFPTHFKKWPPQAVRCSLAGILPISKNWTSRATKTFQKITDGKVFQTLVLYGEPGFCEVSLYPSEGDNGRSVSHLLLDEDVAMPAEGKEVPEHFSEIVEFMAKIMPPEMIAPFEAREESRQPDIQSPSSLPSKPLERYVPPQRKNMDFSLNTSFVPRESSNSTRSGSSNSAESVPANTGMYDSHKPQSIQKQSPKVLNSNTGLEKIKPVNDFFPFTNVSTYPPTPTSPIKSPVKPTASHSQSATADRSYFSRSPPKQEDVVIPSPSQQHNTYQGDGGRFSGHYEPKPPRQRDHRFAANLNILPSPGRQDPNKSPVSIIGTSLLDGQNAAANLEPSYLNSSIPDRHDPYRGVQRSPKSRPEGQQSPTIQHYNPDYKSHPENKRMPSHLPFYPPNYHHGDESKTVSPQINQHSYGAPSHVNLVPPGFYMSPPLPSHQNHDNHVESHRSPQPASMNGDYSYGSNTAYRSPKKDHHDQYNHHGYAYDGQYSRPGGYPSQKYSKSKEQLDYSDSDRPRLFMDNSGSPSRPQLKVKLPEHTSSRSASSEKRGKSKMSPVSPDSADIGEFNIGDIDHARFTSADYFGQRVHEEKMIALQEEAEDIAAESKEQSKLVEMARYGAGTIDDDVVESEEESTDIFQQISEEITSASTSNSKEFEELKRSPIKRNKSADDGPYTPAKLESFPSQYIADIDFAEAIKEALEFSRNDGMENAKVLLDGIVESMKTANVEKQLYDVLMLMLAKAIQDYNLFHRLILDAVNLLNVEMEIKECLGKALKRQQEMCIRLPVRKNHLHLNCSRIMGHLFVMSHGWMDSNSSIQETILATVEKWILFNNKGSQIGQTEKENLFLDCFGAFWEIAGARLTDHNYTFKTRIQSEIKRKILNENVSRPVRERLLDILLELFARCVDTASVHTQTVTRTMIPSSCQVKPSTNTQGTMTKPVQFDDDREYMLDEYTQGWQFLASNTSTDEFNVNQKSNVSQGPCQSDVRSVEKSESLADLSYQFVNADTSIYVTPNESMNMESEHVLNASLDKPYSLSTEDVTSALTKEMSSAKMTKQSSVPSSKYRGAEKSFSNVVKTSPKQQTVTQSASKSASGRSIVDWFDYEPPSEETEHITKPVKVKADVKQVPAQTPVDKSESEVTEKSMKEAEEDKNYPEFGQKTPKSAKTKKHKKNKKSSPNKDSVICSPEKESESQTEHKPLDSYTMPTSLSNNVDGHCTEDDPEEKEMDWWGKEEAASLMGNIYVDTGPDVIIEEEDEEVITDLEDLNIDTGASGDHPLAMSAEKPLSNHNESKTTHDYSPVVNESGENNVGLHTTGVSVEELMDEEIQKLNDAYAFDTDSDDDFDDDNIGAGAVRFDQDFPESNLTEKVHMPSSGQSVLLNENSYDTEFPRSNLRDYLPPILVMEQPSQPRTRWVPRKRVCLNCHDDGHTTENCPQGFLLLQ